MLRSAAKNFESVTVVTDPADYERVAAELEAHRDTSLELGWNWPQSFRHHLPLRWAHHHESGAAEPEEGKLEVSRSRFCPNACIWRCDASKNCATEKIPTRPARSISLPVVPPEGLAAAKQLQGKELSYNNYVDLEAARSTVAEFERPAAVIIKHNNPCGAAEQKTLLDAYTKAFACDPVSAFGGVLAFNHIVDAVTAEAVAKLVCGMHRGAGLCRSRAGDFCSEEKSAATGAAAGRARAGSEAAIEAHPGRRVGTAAGPWQLEGRGTESGHEARADRSGNEGSAVCVESV